MNKNIYKYIKIFLLIILLYYFKMLLTKIFFDISLEYEYRNVELYRYFLNSFLSFDIFTDRYGYGFHIIHSIILFPFLVFNYFTGNIFFNGNGFSFLAQDLYINNIIFYSGRFVSLIGLIITLLYSYKIVFFFTKNKLISSILILLLLCSKEILDNSIVFRVDMIMTGFIIGALYYSIKYLEDFKLKDLYLLIFFSIVSFSIKYQALMFITSIYFIIFFYLLYKKNTTHLYKGVVFFLLIFILFNFNYNQLFYSMGLWFNSNSSLMSLTKEELINLNYGFLDWIKIIFNGFIFEFKIISLIFFIGLYNFILFIKNIKLNNIMLLLIPLIVNYLLHIYVNILNGRHFLLLFIIFPIIAIIGLYNLIQLIDKKNITLFILIVLVNLYTFNIFNNYILNYNKENIDNKTKLNNILSLIQSKKVLFLSHCSTIIPYGLNFQIDSVSYCYETFSKGIKRRTTVGDNRLVRIHDKESFSKVLLDYDIIFMYENDFNRFIEIDKKPNIIYKNKYQGNNYYIFLNEKNN